MKSTLFLVKPSQFRQLLFFRQSLTSVASYIQLRFLRVLVENFDHSCICNSDAEAKETLRVSNNCCRWDGAEPNTKAPLNRSKYKARYLGII